MTYTQLIEELREEYPEFIAMTNVKHIASKSADAIEALQAESASLKQIAELNAQIAIDLKAERDQLQAENERLAHANNALKLAVSGLQAKLDAMGKGKPIYQYQLGDGSWIDQTKHSYDYNKNHRPTAVLRIVYAVPKALAPEPLTDEQITEIARYWSNSSFARSATRFCTDFARAIERVHGIGGTP